MPADAALLRRRIDRFFTDELPAVLAGVDGEVPRGRAWRRALYDAGLAGFGYPEQWGGAGTDPVQAAVWAEASQGRVPREDAVFGIGVGMALPTIRDHGTDAQRARFLRPGLRGEEVWCQLYSEPGAGSDLASLQTSAVLDGDEWVVTGQKVWTSGAQHSQLAILLGRTGRDGPKHRGITMFVLPMEQAGVTVRPLRQMTGVSEFNEVFLDEARIPRDWVIGEVDDGWRMALELLAHERMSTGSSSVRRTAEVTSKTGRNPLPFPHLARLARERGRIGDPLIRQQLADVYAGELIMTWLGQRSTHPSIGKLWRTIQGRAAAELAAHVAFPAGPAWTADDEASDLWNHHILNCRAMSIGGGTDEVQRNTLGERVLGLPREPRP